MLILYFDSGRKPIFRACFNESGIECRSWCASAFSSVLFNSLSHMWRLRSVLRGIIYYFPKQRKDLIIVFDTKVSRDYLRELRRRNPESQIAIWCWNEIKPAEKLIDKAEGLDIWSYSISDCEKYGLRYNTQFYFDSIVERYGDVRRAEAPQGGKSFLFAGRTKGREEKIEAISQQIRRAGWGCEVEYLSASMRRPKNCGDVIRYDELVRQMLGYQGILDIAAATTSGLSLRVMESIFFHKKLITDNSVVMDYDFYDENNIYVWGHSTCSLEEFLERPYRPVPQEIADRYLLSSWASRMCEAYGMAADGTPLTQGAAGEAAISGNHSKIEGEA